MKKVIPLLVIICLLVSSCKKEGQPQVNTVEYSIGCTDCMVVYVSDQNGTQTSEYNQNSSWTYSFDAAAGQQVLLMAHNTAASHQSVTATIKQNGAVLKTKTTYCPINGISFCVDTIR
ncbi:MAG TPA: hypothetical protein VK154_07180 [Chitinophagales bacterium]|nr:hypothetical protein [Chitinophagales bacterium]